MAKTIIFFSLTFIAYHCSNTFSYFNSFKNFFQEQIKKENIYIKGSTFLLFNGKNKSYTAPITDRKRAIELGFSNEDVSLFEKNTTCINWNKYLIDSLVLSNVKYDSLSQQSKIYFDRIVSNKSILLTSTPYFSKDSTAVFIAQIYKGTCLTCSVPKKFYKYSFNKKKKEWYLDQIWDYKK